MSLGLLGCERACKPFTAARCKDCVQFDLCAPSCLHSSDPVKITVCTRLFCFVADTSKMQVLQPVLPAAPQLPMLCSCPFLPLEHNPIGATLASTLFELSHHIPPRFQACLQPKGLGACPRAEHTLGAPALASIYSRWGSPVHQCCFCKYGTRGVSAHHLGATRCLQC